MRRTSVSQKPKQIDDLLCSAYCRENFDERAPASILELLQLFLQLDRAPFRQHTLDRTKAGSRDTTVDSRVFSDGDALKLCLRASPNDADSALTIWLCCLLAFAPLPPTPSTSI